MDDGFMSIPERTFAVMDWIATPIEWTAWFVLGMLAAWHLPPAIVRWVRRP